MLIEKRQILFIDDETNKCEIFLRAMEKTPSLFKCSFVRNTNEALKFARRIPPDFIFFNMTKAGPADLLSLEAIRSEKQIRHIPFFVYATNFEEDVARKAAELGVSKCVKTPKDVRTLVKLLKKNCFIKVCVPRSGITLPGKTHDHARPSLQLWFIW